MTLGMTKMDKFYEGDPGQQKKATTLPSGSKGKKWWTFAEFLEEWKLRITVVFHYFADLSVLELYIINLTNLC